MTHWAENFFKKKTVETIGKYRLSLNWNTYNEEISKPLYDSFSTMSHFPWIYLKHTKEAIGPPPTSWEKGKRKRDLAAGVLRSERGQEVIWEKASEESPLTHSQHGKDGNTCVVLGRTQLGECFFPVRVPGNARFDRAVWEEKRQAVWLKLTDRNHKSVTHPKPKMHSSTLIQLKGGCGWCSLAC